MDYNELLRKSIELSKPYWDLYEQLIGDTPLKPKVDNPESINSHEAERKTDDQQEDGELHPEYLKLIKITREHQAHREKQKRLRQKKNLDVESYYKDISQIDTLIEDNLVDAPNRDDKYVSCQQKEQEMIEIYGGREAYESVRSLEMTIDDCFNRKYRELKPGYWPVIPINYKRYLNDIQ